jgi:hypothetical protein
LPRPRHPVSRKWRDSSVILGFPPVACNRRSASFDLDSAI